MRRYDDPVEVRRGMVAGGDGWVEAPEQFLWHGRLWKVVAVVAHWVETGPWWHSSGAAAVLGGEPAGPAARHVEADQGVASTSHDLLTEREVWRVEAGGAGRGVFDLVFDWAQGSWRLTRCVD